MITNKFRKVFISTFIALIFSVSQLSAVPANPFLQEVIQADGKVVSIAGRGDEFFNWTEDNDGYVVAFDENSKNWCYGYISNQEILPSSVVLGDSEKSARAAKITAADLAPLIKNSDSLRKEYGIVKGRFARAAKTRGLENMNPSILLMLLEYNNAEIVKGIDYWHEQFFGNSQGQLNHYYGEVSNGKFQYHGLKRNNVPVGSYPSSVSSIEFKDDGVVKVKLNKNYPPYSASGGRNNEAIGADLKSAFDAIIKYFDLSQFPQNSGYIMSSDLTVYSVIAGWEASNSSNTDPRRVWAHASQRGILDDNGIFKGISIDAYNGALLSYAVQGEIYSGSMNSSASIMGVGVSAHELGHTLGLPDLYDISGKSQGIGPYSLMAGGSWGAGSRDEQSHRPTHLDAWSKVTLGFVEPIEVSQVCQNSKIDLYSINANADYNVLKIKSTVNSNQYYLLENRGITGYDEGFYRFGISYQYNNDGGVLIYHIDESITDDFGRLDNSNYLRRGVDVEEADGSNILEQQNIYGNAYQYHNHFYSNTFYYDRYLNEFNSTTTPSSNFYNNQNSNISLNINSERDFVMEVEILSSSSKEHDFSLWHTVLAPTCYADGLEIEQCSICGALGEITRPIPKLTGDDCPTVSIIPQKSNNRYGIKFTENPVFDKAEINIILPENAKAVETKIVVYDMTGNIIFNTTANREISWNLTNKNGKFVSNGTYLVIAEIKSQNGQSYYYSAKLGVKR